MKLIQISVIKIAPNRQRGIFPAERINELADSIQRNGLLHPVILRLEGDSFVLVAGECRIRAAQQIYDMGDTFSHDGEGVRPAFIPYTNLGDLDALAAEEAELEENIRRIDLSWQERAAATARLEALRTKQAESKGLPPPTVGEIATEVRGRDDRGAGTDSVRRQLIVSRYLDRPEVAAAKNLDDAFKVIRRTEDAERNRELGEKVGRAFTASVHRCFNEDAKLWLPRQPAETYDVIITDPPYGMGADDFGDSGSDARTKHAYVDSYENFKQLMDIFIPHSVRITKPQAHMYLFCDIDNFADLREWCEGAGWRVFRTPLIWYKKAGFRIPWINEGPQRKYETILYAQKGNKPVTTVAGDVLEISADEPNIQYAAKKPVALFQNLLARSARPGDSVLDICCGSGPVFPAAHELKCKATGLEIDQAAYGMAVKRIEALKAQGVLDL